MIATMDGRKEKRGTPVTVQAVAVGAGGGGAGGGDGGGGGAGGGGGGGGSGDGGRGGGGGENPGAVAGGGGGPGGASESSIESNAAARWAVTTNNLLLMKSKVNMARMLATTNRVQLHCRLRQILYELKRSVHGGGGGGDGGRALTVPKRPAAAAAAGGARVGPGGISATRATTAKGTSYMLTGAGLDAFQGVFKGDGAKLEPEQLSDYPLVTICLDLMMYVCSLARD